MKNDKVLKYYQNIKKKPLQLVIKRFFDIVFSLVLCIFLTPLAILISIFIKIDSPGPVFFKQKRVARYGKIFMILKFRTMVENAENKGPLITVNEDKRITRVGKIIRRFRFDELPQIFNVLIGDMSFVGTRPEIQKYVLSYTDEMKATLLMPPGVTSFASIKFENEEFLIKKSEDVDFIYLNEILPQKMKYNLLYLKNFNFWFDVKLELKTIFLVLKTIFNK
ncbi:MAG: sugar transferase [Oscillospiraceae bacterium]|nr:sugar transferase [Oscillospiraceae bacterium]